MKVNDSKALLKRVLDRMDALGLKAADVSRLSGRRDIVKNIKTAAAKGLPYSPQMGTIQDLARALQTTPGWIMSGQSNQREVSSQLGDQIFAAIEGVLLEAGLSADDVQDMLRLSREACDVPLEDQPELAVAQTRRAIARALARKFLKPR